MKYPLHTHSLLASSLSKIKQWSLRFFHGPRPIGTGISARRISNPHATVTGKVGPTNREPEFGMIDSRHSVTGTVVAELPACG